MRGAFVLPLQRLVTFIALILLVVGCGDNIDKTRPDAAPSTAKELTAFKFTDAANAALTADVTAVINGSQISATVPSGTSVTALVATYSTTGLQVLVGSTTQASGTTANDFSSPVTYRVVAEDGSTRDYTVTVTVASNSAKDITAYAFTDAANDALSADVTATINGTSISATVPFGTNVTALVATFSTTGTAVAVGGTAQVSGTTANDFSTPVTYRVTAGDGSTQDYTVTVTVAANSAKDITAYKFTTTDNPAINVDVIGQINGNAISATVPFGTDVTELIASFTHTGASVTVGGDDQESSLTENDFTNPVVYRVTAADGSTKDYTVTVTIAPNTAKALTAYSFRDADNAALSADVTATINGTAITATVPFGTNVTALTATFVTTGSAVAVGAEPQASGVTPNDFTNPVIYTVTAADGSSQDYTVTVAIAPGTAKEITAFSFLDVNNAALSVDVVANINGTNIAATVPFGTDVTALRATFTTTGASVTVGGTAQDSGQTANNFTSPVTYRVHAADGSTQDYTVTITVALNSAKEITDFSFLSSKNAVLPADIDAQINGNNITATVPFGTNVTALVASFTTTGQSVTVGGTAQTEGITPNNFTAAVVYRVTAEDTTFRDYTVTISIAPSPAKDITAFSFLSVDNPVLTADVIATINTTTKTISATVPFGTNVTALKATFVTTGASVRVGATVQTSGVTANNFTAAVTYRVTAADTTTQDYTVTVTIAPNTAKQLTAFSFESAHNASLSSTVTGVIDQGTHTVAVTVPFGTNVTALKATFAITGESVEVGGVAQTSTQTANNFTTPVTYVVKAADTTTQSYVVTVTFTAPSTTKAITSFLFRKANNPALPTDFVGTITEDDDFGLIDIDLPTGTDVTALIPTFTTTGVGVAINSVPQTSDITPANFSTDPDYVVTAQDGSTRTYAVAVTTKDYCGVLAVPTNGTVTFSNNGFVPSMATYTCDAGFTLTGSGTRQCNAANTWDGTAPTCDASQPTAFWVLKLGDGTANINATAARAVIEERRVSDGGVIRTIALPTTAVAPQQVLTIGGSATTEANMTLSANGRYVTVGGYAAAPGTATVTGSGARVIGRIDAAGNVDTSTRLDALAGAPLRGVSSVDGSGFWASGNGGLFYTTFGSTTGAVTLASDNYRGNFVAGGQLYVFASAAVNKVGTGTPTTAGQTVTAVTPGSGLDAQGVAMLDVSPVITGPDTMYVAIDTSPVTNEVNIAKFVYNGTAWTRVAGFKPSVNGSGNLIRVAAFVEGTSVRVLAVTNAANNNILTFLDNGVSLTPAATVLANATANYAFRGISLPPSP